MGMIAAICTQCGSEIKVDDAKEAGICKSCGTAFITEKVINKYKQTYNIQNANINVNGKNIDNLRLLGDEAYNRGDYKEAYKYYTDVIEIDVDDYERKFKRLLSSAFVTTLNESGQINRLVSELEVYCNKLIHDNSTEDKFSKILYGFKETYIASCNVYLLATKIYMDEGRTISSSYGEFLGYTQNCINNILSLLEIMTNYIEVYPELEITFNDICDGTITILEGFATEFQDSIDQTVKHMLSASGKQVCEDMAIALEQFKKKVEPDFEVSNNLKLVSKQTTSGGCYIATSVYGSYDCPQVWVLRRYRDFVMSNSVIGCIFIKLYYVSSPKIVKWFGDKAWFNRFFKKRLDLIVNNLKEKGFEDGTYMD